MAGACGCESCCRLPGKGLREGLKRLKRLRARQARTSLKTDGWGFEAFEAFEGGQTAGSNVLNNRWLGHVAASCGKASERFEAFEELRAGKRHARNSLKNRWLGHVAARVVVASWENGRLERLYKQMTGAWLRELLPVAWERPAGGFEAFEGGMAGACGCKSCCQLPGKGLREGLKRLKGLTAGNRQARTSLKTDGWGMWLRELLPVAWERPAGTV